jgi:hypothetical protein
VARRKSITKRRRGLFLAKMEASGSVTQAAIAGEIGRSSWYDLRLRDPDFSQLWDDADAVFMDKVEAEGIRRAVVGVNLQVPYTQQNKDGSKETKFRTINTKSDRLLELCLKSRHPLYKPVKAVEMTSPDGSMTPTKTSAPDFTGLTNEEVRTVTRLLRKAHAAGET